jgi:RND family efflux transporter MFP subunit
MAGLSATAAAFLFLHGTNAPAAAQPAAPAAAVVQVTRGNLDQTITLSAELKPLQEVDIHAKIAGYLLSINYDIGDRVRKGALIATLDIVELKDDLNRTNAAYELAHLNYQRLVDVTKARPGLVAQAEVDKARAEHDIAKANYDHARTLLEYATITAPFDGVVTQRFADPGAMIQASVTSSTQSVPLIHLADTSILRLRFPVPESSVAKVHDGTSCMVDVVAAGKTIQATVTRKADRIDSSTRTMMTECDIANPDNKLVPGMYAAATLTLESRKNVLTLPVQAVAGDEKPNVWVVTADDQIEERPVQVGLKTATKVEILDGLKDGDTVVFGNRGGFVLGMKVSPKVTTASDASGSGASG